MKTLNLQTGLFWEEENPEYLSIIERYFHINPVVVGFRKTECQTGFFRGSLEMSRSYGMNYEFTNCLKWVPYFRKYMVDPLSIFNELGYFKDYESKFPLFLRPTDGYKSFAGQVFHTKDRFLEEYNYLKTNRNYTDDLMCMRSIPEKITREWRTVFIDGKYVDGCLYMQGGDTVEVEASIPDQVVDFAKMIGSHSYFINIFDYVIDICEVDGTVYLLEINSFESSSFYGTNLDKIYKTWSESKL